MSLKFCTQLDLIQLLQSSTFPMVVVALTRNASWGSHDSGVQEGMRFTSSYHEPSVNYIRVGYMSFISIFSF